MPVNVYDYTDPGEFLRRRYLEIKDGQPGISHRYIAATLGYRSSAGFSLIVRGRIDPSVKALDGLAKILDLDRDQRDYLALLFGLRKIKDDRARGKLLVQFRSGEAIPTKAGLKSENR